ncbi:SDR family NAD(P)-dependent oxidoreductase [Deinococcus sonorensis]|uniref:SDR family NAD(P)-dependent oxidoreductase n=2 Tax=Deinococcus sonorensis TaxID=309891 RepID=A0AAU7UAJ2_9DEIO
MATLILGATGGIGSALARSWPQEALWLGGRDEERVTQLAAPLQATPLTADFGYESQVRQLFAGLTLPLDTILYAAGAAYPEPLASTSAEHTRRIWNANYFGVLWTLKYGLPHLAPGGRVYVIGARPELVLARGFGQYAASKAAVATLLSVTRLEHRQLTLTLVLPPAVETPLWQQVGRAPRGAIAATQVAQAILQDRSGSGGPELRVE